MITFENVSNTVRRGIFVPQQEDFFLVADDGSDCSHRSIFVDNKTT
jgi:hypothetical protein